MKNYTKNLVSVICLGYKHVNFLKENIFAIWKNKYKNIEIIVIDDGSNDGSVELLNTLASQSPYPMKVIAQENTANVAMNFNRGLQEASGEFVTIMSLDDVLAKDAISSKLELMQKDSKIAFIFNAQITRIDEKSNVLGVVSPFSIFEMKGRTVDALLEYEYSKFGTYFIQGTVYRHDVIDAVGAFNNKMLGDDIVLRCKCYNFLKQNPDYSFKAFTNSACYVREHDNNIHKNTTRQIKLVAEVLEKFFPNRKNPSILYTWLNTATINSSFEDFISMFSHNKRLSLLLNEKIVQDMLKKVVLNDLIKNKGA